MPKANDWQVGGKHYQKTDLQHWDLVAMYGWDYFQGQITKYVMRWQDKGGIQDLRKAQHFLEKYIEVEEAREFRRLQELTEEYMGKPSKGYVDQG